MKRLVLAVAMVLGIFGFGTAWAGEMDVLVSKLVEKGILSPSEAQIVLDETKADVAKQNAKGENTALPAWIQTIKLKGDFRLRYQYNHTNKSTLDQQRARVRLRFGAESKVNDKLMVGLGLATGITTVTDKDAARSTNQTLTDAFAKKPINLDYAYAKYAPYSWIEFIGGKFSNPIWEPTDLVWDTDINPEGASINFKKTLNNKLDVFLNTGIFIIDEASGDAHDPMMYVLQPGFNYKITDKVSLKGAFTYNNSANLNRRLLDGSQSTNTRLASPARLRYSYTVIGPAMQIDVATPLAWTNLPFVKDIGQFSLFSEYVNNALVGDENNGFAIGFNIGAPKVQAFGDWQFKYIYAMLEKDAVLDILPDSDRFSGKTGIRSHEGIIIFGLGKNTALGLDIYRSWGITNSKAAETLVQVDWNLKF